MTIGARGRKNSNDAADNNDPAAFRAANLIRTGRGNKAVERFEGQWKADRPGHGPNGLACK